jgi:uncharacterized membrane protein
MESLLFALTFLAALGAGLISGLFFAFSSFVMTALHRLPSATGISAMQSINVAVLNPLFFAAFFGTAVLCILLVLAGLIRWPESDAIYLIVDALLYLAGTILVTMVCNVPLNNELARVKPESAEGASLWKQYLAAWTAWKHVRTVAALAGAACFTMALVRWPS